MSVSAALLIALAQAAAVAHLPVPVFKALVRHESRWIESAVGGRDGQCVGLTQICLHTVRACQVGSGFDFEAPACQAEKARLQNGVEHLRSAGQRFAIWRKFCLKRTGRADPAHLLSSWGGFDGKGIVCGQRRVKGRWLPAIHPEVKRILEDARTGGKPKMRVRSKKRTKR